MAEHTRVNADISAYDIGHQITNAEMNSKRDQVLQISSEIATLAEQARVGRVQRSEVAAMTAKLAKLGVALPMEIHLALVDALVVGTEPS